MVENLFAFIPGSAAANGAVGDRVAEILRIAGLYAQGQVLEFLMPLITSFAALLYIVAAIRAVAIIATQGEYSAAMRLLIGPPLFYFMLTNTVPAVQTTSPITITPLARVGVDALSAQRVSPAAVSRDEAISPSFHQAFLSLFSPEFQGTPEVSWFFSEVDALISSVIQGAVSVILDTENRTAQVITARDRVYLTLTQASGEDPSFLKLLSKGVMGHCSEATRLSQELSQSRLAGARAGTPEAAEALTKRRRLSYAMSERVIQFDPDEQRYAVSLGGSPSEVAHPVNCTYLWDLTKKGALSIATASLMQATSADSGYPGGANIPWDEVRSRVQKAIAGDANPALANEILASYVIRNTLARTTHSAFAGQLGGRTPFIASRYQGAFDHQAATQGYGLGMRLRQFAATIPYIQGLLLFLLSAAFPFFTVLLIIPSRMEEFFKWMSLWLWVKSWEAGFAVVSVLREILFPFVMNGSDRAPVPISGLDLSRAFEVMNEHNPAANQNTYILIISVLTTAVPVFTAQLCAGTSKLISIFSQSLEGRTSEFYSRARNAKRRDQATTREADMNRHLGNAYTQAGERGVTHSGYTADGTSRLLSGSGALARNAEAEAVEGGFNQAWGWDQANRAAGLAAFSARGMDVQGGTFKRGEALAMAALNRENEALNVRSAGFPDGITFIPGLGSDKSQNMKTGLEEVSEKAFEAPDGEGGD